MKILVLNAGSSSLKYQLLDMENEEVLAKGACGRIGIDGEIEHKTADGRKYEEKVSFPSHTEAFEKVAQLLTSSEYGVVKDLEEISAVGHRLVQGGEEFTESVCLTPKVLSDFEKYCELAPLHNPAGLSAIEACTKKMKPGTPQIAVFDTAFHQTMPPEAYLYGFPYEYYEKMGIRKYGFHGTSHRYVSKRAAQIVGKPIEELKIVTCHLGNGSSIAAVKGGRSIDTTMGFTPLDGLIMGTRSGSVDPSAVTYIMEKQNMTPAQMNDLLNKKSGYLGLSGVGSDNRDLQEAADNGNERAQITLKMQSYQIKKIIGGFAAAMGGLDIIVFTGGIGEHSEALRKDVCSDMQFLGISLDEEKNEKLSAKEAKISKDDSKVGVYIIPTNEELMIARDTKRIVEKG